MYFDPLSAWLVSLISNGIIIAGEKSNNGRVTEYFKNEARQRNISLNARIRRVKEEYGLVLPEMAFEKIQLHIKITKDSFAFQRGNGQIVIDLDNQEYIISVLEACAKRYSEDSPVEEHRRKNEWYRNAAIQARQKKEQYAKELEVKRIKEVAESRKQQTLSKIFVSVGLLIFFAFLFLFFN